MIYHSICVVHNDIARHFVYKDSALSNSQAVRIDLPEISIAISINWNSSGADVSVFSSGKTTTLFVEKNIPTMIDKTNNVSILVSDTDGTEQFFYLPIAGDVFIGRSKREIESGNYNDVVILYPFISGKHIRISCKQGKYYVQDLGSTNGLFLNGKRITSSELRENDILSVYTIQITLRQGALIFHNVQNEYYSQQKKNDCRSVALGTASTSFVRSPRLIEGFLTDTIEIEKQPDAGGPSKFNWLTVLVTPAVSVALMLTLVIALGMSPVMLVMSGVMSVMSAIIAVITYRKQKKQNTAKDGLINQKYDEYLERVQQQIKTAHNQQLQTLRALNPDPHTCSEIVLERGSKLWNRKPEDEDFISVMLGNGRIPAAFTARYQQPQIILEENELEIRAKQISTQSQTIDDAPILCSLKNHKITGVIGNRESEILLARNIIMELATTHSCDELKIVAIIPKSERNQWEWMRWLPHCNDETNGKRYLFTSFESADEAMSEIEDSLSRRKQDDISYMAVREDQIPHYLFLVAQYPWIETQQIRKYLFSDDKIGCSALLLYNQVSVLPKECSQIIEVNGNTGCLYSRTEVQKKASFVMDKSDLASADQLARSLAPLLEHAGKGTASLPKTVPFLEGYGVQSPEQLQIANRWGKAKTFKSLSVPIASKGGNEVFEFDIHEKHHGVNGIVAGMPGSGKTEMVQSWLLSLAVHFSPQDLSFVLIDFKGTGMIAPFREIPHLAGAISNLDTNIDRNLKAIQSEVHRREAIIDKYSAKSIKNVNDLNKSYAKGLVPEKLPILLIVIDEYAEFKKVFPDFGAEIDSLTSKGRALGIFVVLMTQKPAGVVSAKSEDNIKFRWCLRVANYSASREMIGKPDAAKITNPGRCFVKVGEDEVFEEVQSFWSGAPYLQETAAVDRKVIPISFVALNGERTLLETADSKKTTETHETEIDVIVRYITDYCQRNGIPNAEQVWTPRLPDRLELSDVLHKSFDGKEWNTAPFSNPAFGLIDEPMNQKQYPLILDLAKYGNTLIFGAPATGKTTLLQTLALSFALVRHPDEVSMYFMDFGGWNMSVFKDCPHVGGIANDDNPERLKKLMQLLLDIIRERKEVFSEAGVGNIVSYRQIAVNRIPDVILFVDNLGALLKIYPEADSFFTSLTNSGSSYGVYLVATALSANAVPVRISQNIKNTIALQMIDKNDYTYLVGKVQVQLPPIPGRGLIKANPPLEFQTALPMPGADEKTVTDRIRKTCLAMNRAWDGARPRPIPQMPKQIMFGSVKVSEAALGLSADRIQPVEYEWSKQHFLLISGTTQSGKTSLLYAIARQIKEKTGGKLYVFDIKTSIPAICKAFPDTCLHSAAEIDEFIENLRPELQRRQKEKAGKPEARFEPIVIAVDDYSDFFAVVSNDTIARLLAAIRIPGLDLYLLVSGSAYEISSMYNKGEAVLMSLSKAKQAVALGGCLNDHALIQTNASYQLKNVKVGDYEGYFVCNSEPIRFKAMSVFKEVEE